MLLQALAVSLLFCLVHSWHVTLTDLCWRWLFYSGSLWITLGSYGEYHPSRTGCSVWNIQEMTNYNRVKLLIRPLWWKANLYSQTCLIRPLWWKSNLYSQICLISDQMLMTSLKNLRRCKAKMWMTCCQTRDIDVGGWTVEMSRCHRRGDKMIHHPLPHVSKDGDNYTGDTHKRN